MFQNKIGAKGNLNVKFAQATPFQIGLTKCILISFLILFLITAACTSIFGIIYAKPELIIPTTTKPNNRSVSNLKIGQFCLYHNQCPSYAFCSGTCQCPKHYYYDHTTGLCTIRKTYGVACNSDFECNTIAGLVCSTTCQCDPTNQFWNSTYFFATGLALGRCQNKKIHGMLCSGVANEGWTGINNALIWGSTVRRCYCEYGWDYYHSLSDGRCRYGRKAIGDICYNNLECIFYTYGMCMDRYGEGVKRCQPIPIMNWYSSYQWKRDINGINCNTNSYQCNEYKNLKCRYTTSSTTTCQCIDENYYYNSSMCIYGKVYGEQCNTTLSQCVPSNANMVCALPYNNASYTACRCTNSTSYFDLATRTCLPLRNFNATCRDSSECSGGLTGTMFCGQYNGGSVQVCLCTDAYYPSGTTCVAKLTYNTVCSSPIQCYTNLNQTCTGGRCRCITSEYYSSTDSTCQYLKYLGDPCSSGTECWSGTCTSSLCT